MAKLLATELSDKVMYQCLQFFGGYGYMEEFKIARMFRDSRVGTIGGGSSEIMREIIAKMVIDEVSYETGAQSAANGSSGGSHTAAESEGLDPQLLAKIRAQIGKAPALGHTLKFDFGGEQLVIDGRADANAVSTEDLDADCTVDLSLPDFQALITGTLNPMSAVMSGKLKIKGDMGVAMKLQSLFG